MDDIDLSDYTAAQFNCIGKELYMSIYKPFTGIFNGNARPLPVSRTRIPTWRWSRYSAAWAREGSSATLVC